MFSIISFIIYRNTDIPFVTFFLLVIVIAVILYSSFAPLPEHSPPSLLSIYVFIYFVCALRCVSFFNIMRKYLFALIIEMWLKSVSLNETPLLLLLVFCSLWTFEAKWNIYNQMIIMISDVFVAHCLLLMFILYMFLFYIFFLLIFYLQIHESSASLQPKKDTHSSIY